MSEFDLIRQLVSESQKRFRHDDVVLGPGDDAAIQAVPAGHQLAFSIDTVVEGVHFPSAYAPEKLARRALAVAVSDLAAMGADPVCYTLALTVPEADNEWLTAFSQGLAEAGQNFEIALAGGDITRGPLAITIQVHGTVPVGQAITRSGASAGDLICISGTLGDAGAALEGLDQPYPDASMHALLARYHSPEPRIALGKNLRSRATAAIDISDGLLADLSHLLTASGCGGEIDRRLLPLSGALKTYAGKRATGFALSSGDDYELCFTLPETHWPAVANESPVPVCVIGRVTDQSGLSFTDGDQEPGLKSSGFNHFETPTDLKPSSR